MSVNKELITDWSEYFVDVVFPNHTIFKGQGVYNKGKA